MPAPRPVTNPVNDARRFDRYPSRDDRGSSLGGTRVTRAPSVTVINQTINNTTIINNINTRVAMGSRLQRNHHYWFHSGGVRYSHYYDTWGINWFGFYTGSSYFWARWHGGAMWWHDASRSRWLHYRDGFWWYQPSPTIVYIYRDGYYYRYEPVRGGYRAQPEAPAQTPGAPSEPEQPAGDDTMYYSEDGARLVQVMGERREAFLYDATGAEPAFLAFLAAGAEDVVFSSGEGEGALQILVIVKEDEGERSFKLFDGDGNPHGAPVDSVDPEAVEDSAAFSSLSVDAIDW